METHLETKGRGHSLLQNVEIDWAICQVHSRAEAIPSSHGRQSWGHVYVRWTGPFGRVEAEGLFLVCGIMGMPEDVPVHSSILFPWNILEFFLPVYYRCDWMIVKLIQDITSNICFTSGFLVIFFGPECFKLTRSGKMTSAYWLCSLWLPLKWRCIILSISFIGGISSKLLLILLK